MKRLEASRDAIGICAAVAILAGCAGLQPASFAQASSDVAACPASGFGKARCGVMLRARAGMSRPDVGSGPSGGWGPDQLQDAYDLPSSSKGSGHVVAIVDAYDNPNVASDLAHYRSTFDLPPGKFYKYNQEGQRGNYPAGNMSWGIEIDLDTQMVSASCPKCTIYLVEAESASSGDLEAAEAEAVTLGAHIVSNSYLSQDLSNKYYDAPGVTYLASSGDSFGGGSFPADFDSVVAVGGTILSKDRNGKRGWTERVLDSSAGGCIKTQPKPRWQHDTICNFRLANDVSAVAYNVAEYDSYGYPGWMVVDGTSIPAPFLAGVFGLADNATQQNGGRTFWHKAHHKYLYNVCGSSCTYGRYSTAGGWGSPRGIGAF